MKNVLESNQTIEVETVVSKADRKGADILREKATNVAELLGMWIMKNGDNLYELLTEKNSKGQLRARDLKGEHMLLKFAESDLSTRTKIVEPIIKYIMVASIEGHVPVQLNSVLSAVSRAVGKVIADGGLGGLKIKRLLSDKISSIKTDTRSKYQLVGAQLADALLLIMSRLKLTHYTQETTNKGHKQGMIQGIDENLVILQEEKNLLKYLSKEASPMFMDFYPSYWEYGQTRNKLGYSLYCGSPKKYNQGAQPEHVYDYANKIIGTAYTLVPQLINPNHPLGKRFTQLMHNQLAHQSQIQRYDTFLEEYMGESLYPRVQFVPDNGRDYILGVHSGAMFWLYEFEDKRILTPEEGARLADRIAELEKKGKLKAKEECELLHYMAAYENFLNGKPTGCQVTRDFKGSGPMCQSILTKNLDQLQMSIEYDGKHAKDPYNTTLKHMDHKIIKNWTNVLKEEGQDAHQIGVTLRNWMKGLSQPVQYGGGKATAEESSAKNYGNRIPFDDFKPAFDEALPATKAVLGTIKSWASCLSKTIALGHDIGHLNRIDYITAGGFKATITPLSEGFEHTYTSFGRTRSVPMKIVDLEQHSVKTAAAGSHQLDAGIKMMLVLLFGDKVGPVHDDFRVQLSNEIELEEKAKEVILYFWNKPDLFDNYLRQVFKGVSNKYGHRAGYKVLEIPELDTSKIDTILFS